MSDSTKRGQMLRRILDLIRLLVLDSWTADDLADELGRTERTIYRDLRVLREVGIEVRCEDGVYSIEPEDVIDALTRPG